MQRSELIVYGLVFPLATMCVEEIMTRFESAIARDVIRKHRDNIFRSNLVREDMAWKLKSRSEFRRDCAAHHAIDQMTNDLE